MELEELNEKLMTKILKETILNDVIPLLANGMAVSFSCEELNRRTTDKIYNNAIIWLYRLLILLYAESRNILPINSDYYNISLQKMQIEVTQKVDNGQIYSVTKNELFERLQFLFNKIRSGDEQLEIIPFYSRLFEESDRKSSILIPIPDQMMAKSIDYLSRVRIKSDKPPIWIDYSKLSIKYLGNIYESLRGFQLITYENKLNKKMKEVTNSTKNFYLVEDNTIRKNTGSFYSPDYIVNFIIKETIDPTLSIIKEEFISHLKKFNSLNNSPIQEKLRAIRKRDPIDRMLNLSILDPAVGNGVFIVAAFKHLSKWTRELLKENYYVNNHLYIFTPLLSFQDDVITPIKYIERLILKRCLYGIDLDPICIELTKFTLWLTSYVPKYPFTFLDHHFKVGNSLLSINYKKLPQDYKKDLLTCLKKDRIINEQVNFLLNTADLNFNQVVKNKHIYQRIEDYICDKRMSSHFQLWISLHTKKKEERKRERATTLAKSYLKGEINSFISDFEIEVFAEAKKDKFFHFELEFFHLFVRKHLSKSTMFDFVITNPPYGGNVLDHHKIFFSTVYGTHKDTAAYFARKILSITNRFGIILPKTLAFYSQWADVRKAIFQESNLHHIMDTGLAFEDANYETIVLIGGIKKSKEVKISVARPLRSYIPKKTIVNEGIVPTRLIHLNNIIIFRGISQREFEILQKIDNVSIPLKKIIKSKNNIFRGVYIPDKVKSDVITKKSYFMPEQENLTSEKIIWIDKVPHVSKYLIKRYHLMNLSLKKAQKYLEKVQKTQVPRIFLKVLRGNRLIGYPDHEGKLCTTEKLVNIILPSSSSYSLWYICGIINSPYPSFYLNNVLFSKTTETSRVMDYPYSSLIPIPQVEFNASISYRKTMISLISKEIEVSENTSEEVISDLLNIITDHKSHIIHDLIVTLVQRVINTNKSIRLKQYEFFNFCLTNYQEIKFDLENDEKIEIYYKLMEQVGKEKWTTLIKRLKKVLTIPSNKFQQLENEYKVIYSQIVKESKLVTYLNCIIDELARISFGLNKNHKEIVLSNLGKKL